MAGGGYGKTTAIRGLAAGHPACWMSLTAADREVEALSSHVAEALGLRSSRDSAAPAPAIGAADRQGLAEGCAALICAELDSRDGPVMLILDDVDQLADGDSGTGFLTALCLQAPPQLHIVLAGRQLPALGLGSASGRGELIVLSAPDLAFTREETAELLTARLGAEAATLADECWSLTTGWAAALQLITDRLERFDATQWGRSLEELRQRRGSLWRDFAGETFDREPPSAQRILAIAGVAPAVDAELLEGIGMSASALELDSLQTRGLLVAGGEHGTRTLSPVLSEVVAERLQVTEAQELRERIVDWLERVGRLEAALECAAGGARGPALALVRRQGRALVAGGYGSRVAAVLRELGTAGELELDTIRGEALVAIGDWDGAMEIFGTIARRGGGTALPPATAWRYGALLYLRGDNEAAQRVLAAAQRDGLGTSDDALVSAWLSSALWGLGDNEQAEATAEVALRQAEASGDASARAAAHVAVALAAASQGNRERNERHHRLALNAAREAGDSVQLTRTHANLSSKAVEDGDYARAIAEADGALNAGAGHPLFRALAMSNKAEALMHRGQLDEARGLAVQAIEVFSGLGSLVAAAPYVLLGELDIERGDLARARASLDRAHRLAEQSGDVHTDVFAMAGLARISAQDDPEGARRLATAAVERATSLERAPALCALAWVELCAGDRPTALRLAVQAEAEASSTDDRPSLARALELQGAAGDPPSLERFEAAAGIWHELGDPIASRRAELMVAARRGDAARADALREELSRFGVRPESGIAGLLLSAGASATEIDVRTLGRFTVLRGGQPIPLAAWQSRKARDLLKLLAARRGRPVTRDAAAEALWPGEDAGPLSNRLSVALSTLRKVLDPDRAHPADHFIAADQQSLALRVDRVSLDVEAFLAAAASGVALASREEWAAAESRLRAAEVLYTGDFLEEDLYEDWPVDCREEARSAAQEVSRLLARAAMRRDDDEEATRHLRRLLERDPYDADAWTAMMAAQLRLRRYGEARRQHALYARRMAELAIPPIPLAQTLEARP